MRHQKDARDASNGQFLIKDYRMDMALYRRILQATQTTSNKTRQDIDAYLAGFFDGEGHISISRGNGTWLTYVEIGATQVDRTPLDMLVKAYGGYVIKKKITVKNRQQCYAWKCSGKDAMFALYRMILWLKVKSKKARAALIILQNRPLSVSGGEMSSKQKMAITKALKDVHVITRKALK